MNHSLYDSVTPHYPTVQASNYDQYHYSSEPRFWAEHLTSYQGQRALTVFSNPSGKVLVSFGQQKPRSLAHEGCCVSAAPPIGSGVHMGTHSGRSFYAGESTTQTLSITRPFFTVNRTATAFGRLLLMIREVRNPISIL